MVDLGLQLSGDGKGSTYTILRCTFDSGTWAGSSSFSEGLDVAVSANTFVLVDSCNFINHVGDINQSYGSLLLKSGRISVMHSFFSNNKQRLGPLTVFNLDDNLDELYVSVSNSTFTLNVGLESAAIFSNHIRKAQTLTFTNLTMRNNKGYLYIVSLVDGPQTFSDSLIEENEASSGAIRIMSRFSAAVIGVLDCVIRSNFADNNIGGLSCKDTPISLLGSTIKENFVGNVSDSTAQIVCDSCPGCVSSGVVRWYMIVIPVICLAVAIFSLCAYMMKKRRVQYEYITD